LQKYLSHFLEAATPTYGGSGAFAEEITRSLAAGDTCNARAWSFPNHIGTHVDLPHHFFADGGTLSDYSADYWSFHDVFTVVLEDVRPGVVIGSDCLKDARSSTADLLLLKTGFGRLRGERGYWQESPIMLPELADSLRSRFPMVRAFGFDLISVSSLRDRQLGREAHRAFLRPGSEILLIEDMDLSLLQSFTVVESAQVAPLLVKSADAAPCTVIGEVKG